MKIVSLPKIMSGSLSTFSLDFSLLGVNFSLTEISCFCLTFTYSLSENPALPSSFTNTSVGRNSESNVRGDKWEGKRIEVVQGKGRTNLDREYQ